MIEVRQTEIFASQLTSFPAVACCTCFRNFLSSSCMVWEVSTCAPAGDLGVGFARCEYDCSGPSCALPRAISPPACDDRVTSLLADPSSLGIAQSAKRHAEDVLPDELPPAEQAHGYGHILRDIPAV